MEYVTSESDDYKYGWRVKINDNKINVRVTKSGGQTSFN